MILVKILLILLITIFITACGRDINTLSEGDSGDIIQPVFPRSVILESEYRSEVQATNNRTIANENYNDHFEFPSLAKVRVPQEIYVLTGNAGNFFAKLTFNLNKNTQFFDFYCLYQGGADSQSPIDEDDFNKGLTYQFLECYDWRNTPLGMNAQFSTWIDRNRFVKLEILGADPRFETRTRSSFDVDWR